MNLVVRVPAAQFDKAMEEIRAVASRIVQEKRTGKDVTEEFIDLEARMKDQKALEVQFLEIMKRAGRSKTPSKFKDRLRTCGPKSRSSKDESGFWKIRPVFRPSM